LNAVRCLVEQPLVIVLAPPVLGEQVPDGQSQQVVEPLVRSPAAFDGVVGHPQTQCVVFMPMRALGTPVGVHARKA